ncbi:MAG: HPr family phosphocarrier protein [Gammaproteobacteria bacterium]|nr:HPr family phosphocarrier protein [Gammaproteobacteria bacterium]
MIERDVPIINKLGLHARAAAKFVTLASTYSSDIQLARNQRTVNGKSIMGVMMLAAAKGSTVKIIANGADEQEALDNLAELVNNRFGESE